ncbi:hypothetical protein HYT23_01745 [Candidatus Pacearchaeota archaeon]|nr:hypothetical protein [Candidatus Pacearchaeota archaeon]
MTRIARNYDEETNLILKARGLTDILRGLFIFGLEDPENAEAMRKLWGRKSYLEINKDHYREAYQT